MAMALGTEPSIRVEGAWQPSGRPHDADYHHVLHPIVTLCFCFIPTLLLAHVKANLVSDRGLASLLGS
jgi:hypothetical protein